jgi:alkylation response protein AidB-like acyl-CoA dehydrogenase
VAAFYASGLGAVLIPREHGGAGVSAVTTAEIFATISAADPSLGQIPQNHSAFLELLRYSLDEAQKRKFFTLALQGASFGKALAERHGKTTKDISRRLTRQGADYVPTQPARCSRLNGKKIFKSASSKSRSTPPRRCWNAPVRPLTPAAAQTRSSIAVAEAKVSTTEIAIEATNKLLSSVAPDRRWRI